MQREAEETTEPKGSGLSSQSKPSEYPSGNGSAPFEYELLYALQAIRAGDFSVRMTSEQAGVAGKIVDAFNEIAAANQRMAQQLDRALAKRALEEGAPTAADMLDAVLVQFPVHDLLIMAAAVADFRPRQVHPEKLQRGGTITIECESTQDIVASAGALKRPDQRTIGFSLEARPDLTRARAKLAGKNLDLIVCNSIGTMSSETDQAILLWRSGGIEHLPAYTKGDFARILLARAAGLFRSDQAGSGSP